MSTVTCITVTYGQRRAMLEEVIQALISQSIDHIVVVDNGATWPVKSTLERAYAGLVTVLEMTRNLGSAAGYAAGLRHAETLDSDFVLLLDDDNKPEQDCLSRLKSTFLQIESTSDGPLAVLAFRPEHQTEITEGENQRLGPRINSFRGFHIIDIPKKLLGRVITKPAPDKLPERVMMEIAPYSGLFFRKDLIFQIGTPRADFVLYADDSEFTYRINASGGQIVLVTSAKVKDLESSWNTRGSTRASSFSIILNQGSDLRAYYGTRNGVYFGYHCRPKSRVLSWINRAIYLALLRLHAMRTGRVDRYRLVRQAVKDGLNKQLGEHRDFPLR
ncbi:glycosyltransferase [Luteimonas sp. TWI662]|uniref:glycosyltransferase n=1 Tax=Luteimonas sp. TWI662 TaxID=3136789 RepID=UPI00320A8AAB